MATIADELLQLKALLDDGVITEEDYNKKKMDIMIRAEQARNSREMPSTPASANSKTIAGILGIVLGFIGAHKFYLGYTKEGFIMLGCSLVGSILMFPPMIVWIIGIIEGIGYLAKNENDFQAIYVNGHKGWF